MRQVIVTVMVVAAAAAGWYYYSRDAGSSDEAAATGEVRGPGGPGGPGGGAGRPGGGRPGGGFGGGATLVVTAPVNADQSDETFSAIGSVTALRSVELYAQVTGIVDHVAIEPGNLVEPGDVLVHLDSGEQEIALERAELALADAKGALERAERLGQTNAVSQVTIDNAASAVKGAEIDLRSAKLALSRRDVTAPFAGVVGLTDLSEGDLVTQSTLVTTLDDLSTLIVPFSVPERFVGRVAVGQKVTAIAEALRGTPVGGQIVSTDSRVAVTTRSLTVKAALDGAADGRLKPGMAVTISVDLPTASRLSVPSAAIQWDREGSFVWTVAEGKAKRTAVSIEGRRTGAVLVAGTLQAGDEVVVEGVQKLREGLPVATAGNGPPGQPSRPNAPAGANRQVPGQSNAGENRRPVVDG